MQLKSKCVKNFGEWKYVKLVMRFIEKHKYMKLSKITFKERNEGRNTVFRLKHMIEAEQLRHW